MKKTFYIIFGFKILLSLVLLYFFDENIAITHDSKQYLELADNLWTGKFGRFYQDYFYQETIRTPIYPFFLMLTKFLSIKGIIFIQLLFYFSTVLIFKKILSENYQLSPFKLYLFSTIFLLDFVGFFHAFQILTEVFFTFLLLISIYYFHKKEKLYPQFLAGLFFALAMLCRPILSYFIPFIIIYFVIAFFKNKSYQKAIVYFASLAILILPYLAYNYHYFNRLFISNIGEINLFHYRAGEVFSIKNNMDFKTASDSLYTSLKAKNKLQNFTYKDHKYIMNSYQNMKDISLEIILKNPHITFYTTLKSVFKLLLSPSPELIKISVFNNVYLSYSIIAFQFLFNVFIIIYLVYLKLKFSIKQLLDLLKKYFFYFTLLVYLILASSGAETGARFKVPILPLFVLSIAILSQNFKHER
jgi:4-amino-4-deoxy-L-arabinose transferase-like glycosyltransferase